MSLQSSIQELERAVRQRAYDFHGKPLSEVVIGVDFDGIMFDMHYEVLLHQNRRNHETDPVILTDITSWDSHKRLFNGDTAVYSPTMYNDRFMRPVPGAKEGVKRLSKAVKKLVCVSHAPSGFVEPKIKLLEKHFPDIKEFNWVTDAKHHIEIDWLIDDGAHNLDGAPYRGILFDYPWNRHYTDAVEINFPLPNVSTWPKVWRVWGWNDVMSLFGQSPVVTHKNLKAEYDKRYKDLVDYHLPSSKPGPFGPGANRPKFYLDHINLMLWFIQHSRQLLTR